MAITLRAPDLARACVALGTALACALPATPALAECLGMKIHAHRGSAESPENSASALRSAYAGDWDGVEIDMQQLADGTWVLHAGDAFFAGGQLETPATCPRTLSAFQVAMAVDNKHRRANVERLREVAAGHPEVTVICAHDKAAYDRLSG